MRGKNGTIIVTRLDNASELTGGGNHADDD